MDVRQWLAVSVLASLACLTTSSSTTVLAQFAPRSHFPLIPPNRDRGLEARIEAQIMVSDSPQGARESFPPPEIKHSVERTHEPSRGEGQVLDTIPRRDEALQAIADVRQRFGGVASHLTDLFPKEESEAVFQKELAKLQTEVVPDVLPVAAGHSLGPSSSNRQPIGPIPPETMVIRNIASSLDRLAEQLEQLSRYQDADQIRVQAQTLRESVRELSSGYQGH